MCTDELAVVSATVVPLAGRRPGFVYGLVVPFNPQRIETRAGVQALARDLTAYLANYHALLGDEGREEHQMEGTLALVERHRIDERHALMCATLVPGVNSGRDGCVAPAGGDTALPTQTGADHYLFYPLEIPVPGADVSFAGLDIEQTLAMLKTHYADLHGDVAYLEPLHTTGELSGRQVWLGPTLRAVVLGDVPVYECKDAVYTEALLSEFTAVPLKKADVKRAKQQKTAQKKKKPQQRKKKKQSPVQHRPGEKQRQKPQLTTIPE